KERGPREGCVAGGRQRPEERQERDDKGGHGAEEEKAGRPPSPGAATKLGPRRSVEQDSEPDEEQHHCPSSPPDKSESADNPEYKEQSAASCLEGCPRPEHLSVRSFKRGRGIGEQAGSRIHGLSFRVRWINI